MYSGKPPVFEDKEMFRVTIPLLRDENYDEKDLVNLANGTLNDTLNDTLKILRESPNIKQKEIAQMLNVSYITIKRNIKELKDLGYIERIGARKNGYWKILK